MPHLIMDTGRPAYLAVGLVAVRFYLCLIDWRKGPGDGRRQLC